MTVPDAPGLSQVVLPDGARLRPMGRQDLAAVARAEAALFGAEAWSPALLRAELAAASGAGADRCYVVVDRAAGERGARTGASGPGGPDRGGLAGYAGLWFGDGGGDADLLTVATVGMGPSAHGACQVFCVSGVVQRWRVI